MTKVSLDDRASETRRDWCAPRLTRLAASEAEFGVAGSADAEGMS